MKLFFTPKKELHSVANGDKLEPQLAIQFASRLDVASTKRAPRQPFFFRRSCCGVTFALSLYFHKQKPPRPSKPSRERCCGCSGLGGNSLVPCVDFEIHLQFVTETVAG